MRAGIAVVGQVLKCNFVRVLHFRKHFFFFKAFQLPGFVIVPKWGLYLLLSTPFLLRSCSVYGACLTAFHHKGPSTFVGLPSIRAALISETLSPTHTL